MTRRVLITLGVVVTAIAGLFILSFLMVGRPYSIMSRSMLPLLKPDDVVFCSGDDARQLTYGDVIVYTHPNEKAQGAIMLHMAVGFGGDTVQVKGGNLWINGEALASRRAGEFEIPESNGQKVPRFEETLPGNVKSLVLIEDPEVESTTPTRLPCPRTMCS